MSDISKLPKWAQSRISKLEADVSYHKSRYQEVVGEKDRVTEGRLLLEPRAANSAALSGFTR